MNKFSKIITGIATSAVLAFGGAAVTAQPAEAKVGGVRVNVVSGGTLYIYCSYGSSSFYKLTNGQNSQQFCKANNYDTDQIKDPDSKRCIYVSGVSGRNGWWILPSNTKVKIDDVSTVGVHTYSSKCSSKKVWPLR